MSEEAQAAASDASKQPAEGGAHSPRGADAHSLDTTLSQVTASSAPPTDNSNGSKWICEVCTYENYPLSRKCTMCRSAKPVLGEDIFRLQDGASALPAPPASPSPPTSPTPPDTIGAEAAERLKPLRISSPQAHGHSSSCSVAKWPCPTCTYENWPRSSKCAMCGAPPGSPPARARPAPGPPPARARPAPGADVNELCANALDESGRRSKKSQTHANIDWVWLQACLGVVEGSSRLVHAYLAAGGDPARALTAPEVALLNRASAFDAGHTLVHLAIRFQRQDILAALLARIQGGGPGLKRAPSSAAPELAAAVRRQLAAAVRYARDRAYLGEWSTFRLPRALAALPAAARDTLLAELLDRDAQATLEDAALVNWGGEARLHALWNRSAGDCLPDAVCQAAYGVADRADTLRAAAASWLRAGGALAARWRRAERAAAAAAGYTPTDAQLRAEWARLAAAAEAPRTPLHQLHVFVLAHVLRRPLVVYGLELVTSFRGEALGYARFQGVYLPLLWEPAQCCKAPLALGYTRGHFSALVPLEPAERYICAEADTFLPLTDSEGRLLPVHFLSGEEAGAREALLRRWLSVCARAGVLCARVPPSPPSLLQAQMLEEWLNHYRRLAQQSRGPFPPRLEYSSEPEPEDE